MRNLLLSVGLVALVACSNTSATNHADANETVVKNVYTAFKAGDVGGVVAPFTPGIVWNEAESFIYAGGNPYVGADAIISGVFAKLGGEWTDFRAVPSEYIADESHVTVLGRYTGIYNATGKSADAQFAHVWTVQDGKITAFQQYTDTAQFVETVSGGNEDTLETELLENYLTAINSNDTETFMAMVTDDVVFQVPHSPEIVGKTAMRDWVAGYYAAYTTKYNKTSLDFTLRGDMAVERYVYTSTDTDRITKEMVKDAGKGLVVYRRGADGKWRVARDAWSTDLPIPQ